VAASNDIDPSPSDRQPKRHWAWQPLRCQHQRYEDSELWRSRLDDAAAGLWSASLQPFRWGADKTLSSPLTDEPQLKVNTPTRSAESYANVWSIVTMTLADIVWTEGHVPPYFLNWWGQQMFDRKHNIRNIESSRPSTSALSQLTSSYSATLPAKHVRASGLFGCQSNFVELFAGSSPWSNTWVPTVLENKLKRNYLQSS